MLRESLTPGPQKAAWAETIALKGLGFLATRPEDIDRFLTLSGLEVDELRSKAGDPNLLRAVLEFILADDAYVTALCQELEIQPRDLHAASQILEHT